MGNCVDDKSCYVNDICGNLKIYSRRIKIHEYKSEQYSTDIFTKQNIRRVDVLMKVS